MMRFGLLLSIITISFMADGASAADRVRMRVDSAKGSYEFAVSDEGRVRITCVTGCRVPVNYEEDGGAIALGVFRPANADNLVFVTWVSGSAGQITAYVLDGTKTRRVFVESSLGTPDVIGSDQQGIVVRAHQYATQRTRKIVRRSWRWNMTKQIFIRLSG